MFLTYGGMLLGSGLFDGLFFDACQRRTLRSSVAGGLDLWIGLADARVGYSLEAAFASWYTLKPV